jgi:pimeloyl-ACP methyl ester carboxylesterase
VLLLHGVGGGKAVWPAQLAALAQAGYRAVAWDMPGYGDSPAPESFTMRALADQLRALIASLQATTVVLLGHSMGGMVAQEFLALYPQEAHGALLSGTSPAFGNSSGTFQQAFLAKRLEPLAQGRSMADLAPELLAGMLGPAPDAAGKALATQVMGGVAPATYRAALQAIVQFDQRANLSALRLPVLCLAGEHDRNAAPSVMEKMAARIPGARYQCLPNVGHLANLEHPASFNAAMLAWLREHFPQA